MLLAAGNLALSVDLSGLAASSPELPSGWGSLTAPGTLQIPVKSVNVVLPATARNLQFTYQFSGLQSYSAPAPTVNPAFTDGERVLNAPFSSQPNQQVVLQGKGLWGDVAYASFRIMPAQWTGAAWQSYGRVELKLSWDDAAEAVPNRIPPVLNAWGKSPSGLSFFANPQDLDKYYVKSGAKNYDYLIVSTPELYAAVSPLEAFHQGQGMITAFADIAAILASSPGATDGEKLRNYLAAQYNSHPFTYLLLVGDHDTVPVMHLIPEPDGGEEIPSDFFYGDLSSIVDTDSDGRLGEYSPGIGLQDYLCDYTPEVFVGRISTNSATLASQIATRTVSYEQSTAPWKQHALLPAAYLNYGGEPEPIYLQTDGATFMEYARNTVLSDWQTTTMYEQTGYIPSYPSDLALDYDLLKTTLSSTSYGILNWSAHGSSTSSSRKVWLNDSNQNFLPDNWEMDWLNMVNRQTFDNLVNQDGLMLFAASCYNGMIDADQQCLAEYALQKKAVNAVGATRTGWYKIGWATPGWGGCTSYNFHWLENLARNDLSAGAANAFAGLTHTQYYLFGDPVDAGGIIWPELQNVYTYLNYGDPAVRHTPQQAAPQGEILVYEPWHHNGLEVVNALNAAGNYNVVYTERMIPDYDYMHQFEAVFCLFGWGDTAYVLSPDSLDYSLLNAYLAGGGRMYLEGDVGWDPLEPFWGKFGTHSPLDTFAYIENITQEDYVWQYDDQADPYTYIPIPYAATAQSMFSTYNLEHPNHPLAVYNYADGHATLASAFALNAIVDDQYTLADMLRVILDVLLNPIVATDDPHAPPVSNVVSNFPNPFTASTSLRVELTRQIEPKLEIFNLRGQKVRALQPGSLARGEHELLWDGRDDSGRKLPAGIYFWRLQAGNSRQTGKMLKLNP